jgi:hypothetical protein
VTDQPIIGTIGVAVVPNAEDFWVRFKQQTRGQADPTGRKLGEDVAKGVGSQGGQAGDEFGRKMRTRLDAALKSLPAAKITADSSEADRKLEQLRKNLATIGNARVQANISDATALRAIDHLRVQLDELSRKAPDVRVRVNSGAALAELAALKTELNALDGATANVGTSGEQSFSALTAAASTVGPALVPLGSGITGLATSLIGIGTTGALAFKGIQAEIAANTALGQRYTASLGDMKAGLAGLETSAANGFLGGFEKTVGSVTAQMPQLNAFIGQTSNVLGDLAAHGASALLSLFTALEPVILQSMRAVDGLASRFEAWASGPGGSKLFAQLGDDIPLAVNAIGNLAVGAGHLVEAFAPVGTVLLGAINGVAHAIAAIPVPVLEALATAFIATKIAGAASLGITTLAAKANIQLAGSADVAAASQERLAAASGVTVGRLGTLVGGIRSIVPAYIVANLAAGSLAQSTKTWADSQNTAVRTLHAGLDGLNDVLHGKLTLPSVFGDISAQEAVRQARTDQAALKQYFDQVGAAFAKNTFQSSAGGKYAANATNLNSSQLGLIDRSASMTAATDALAQYGAALQKNIDTERAWLAQGKQTVEIQGLGTVAAKTWEAALAETNGNYTAAINLVRGHKEALKSDTEAQAEAAIQQAQVAHFVADAAAKYSLTADQVNLYTRAVGLNIEKLGLTPAALAGAEQALAAVVHELQNGTTATDAWLAAVAKFDSAGDTAATRGALIGSALRAANGDMLAFTGSMTGVTSANFALTNAFQDQATAADSAARAVMQAQDGVTAALDQQQIAEGSLASAQLSALAAQRALTTARVDAKRALEDLHNQVIDGALSERRAVLDLASARAAEAKTPSAANALSVDEAVQRLAEIRLQNKRLADEKRAADKAGIEGSQQVAAAQQGITAALKAVADAQRQQTTAAKGVLAAQQAVADATNAQAKALATSERAAIDAKTGLIDYSRQGAAPLVTQLQAVQDAAEKAAGATYQHELKTKGATKAADDAYTVYVSKTKGYLEDNATQFSLTNEQAGKLATNYFGLKNAGDIKKRIEMIGNDKVTSALQGILADLDIISGKTKLAVTADTSQATGQVKALLKLLNLVPAAAAPTGGVKINYPGIPSANGNILDGYGNRQVSKFADGAHIAQIGNGRTRIWDEPETGGEAYIPLAAQKRSRSEAILAEVAARFGGQYLAPGSARGGSSRVMNFSQNNYYAAVPTVDPALPALRRASTALA